jgi:hypothetical protein
MASAALFSSPKGFQPLLAPMRQPPTRPHRVASPARDDCDFARWRPEHDPSTGAADVRRRDVAADGPPSRLTRARTPAAPTSPRSDPLHLYPPWWRRAATAVTGGQWERRCRGRHGCTRPHRPRPRTGKHQHRGLGTAAQRGQIVDDLVPHEVADRRAAHRSDRERATALAALPVVGAVARCSGCGSPTSFSSPPGVLSSRRGACGSSSGCYRAAGLKVVGLLGFDDGTPAVVDIGSWEVDMSDRIERTVLPVRRPPFNHRGVGDARITRCGLPAGLRRLVPAPGGLADVGPRNFDAELAFAVFA